MSVALVNLSYSETVDEFEWLSQGTRFSQFMPSVEKKKAALLLSAFKILFFNVCCQQEVNTLQFFFQQLSLLQIYVYIYIL